MTTLALALHVALASPARVPAKLQAALFWKLVQFDGALQGKGPGAIKVLIVHTDDSRAAAEEMATAFEKAGMPARIASEVNAAALLEGSALLYVMPGVQTGRLSRALVDHRVLSISGTPELTESGEVAVSIGIKDNGKPEIVVSLERMKREGHRLSADVLDVARVIRD